MVTRSSINRLLKEIHLHRPSGRLQNAATKKMLTSLTIWFRVKKIGCRLTKRYVKSHAEQAFG